ncbi:Serine/threonine-protein kinase ATR [Oopsacas minuta]|uniref:Serine/threonine-protein kinase ATR n=1 Tax=Oopsacas minuta TaxID=111878 RepID=A0AAV7KF59_9METZ|nr:Serine/threonine-protein kinase ATR [Oopsacas minuta]
MTQNADATQKLKLIQHFTYLLFKTFANQDTPKISQAYNHLLSNDGIFFSRYLTCEVHEHLMLSYLENILHMLRITDVENQQLCDGVYKLIYLLVDISITQDFELVRPCDRFLRLFVDLSEAILTINEHGDVFYYPLEFVHFQYDYSKCSNLLPFSKYVPLLAESNEQVIALFIHSLRIITSLHKLIRHFKHRSPKLYNMVSVYQLWNELGRNDIRISTELVSLGTAICLSEFYPVNPPLDTTLLDELKSFLSMLTGEAFHKLYHAHSQDSVFHLFVDKVCRAMEVFKIAISELNSHEDNFIRTLATQLSISLFSPSTLSLPSSIAFVVSQLLHDCLLISPSSSLPNISLIDTWHRSSSLCHASLLPIVLAPSLFSYTHLRSLYVGYPHNPYAILYTLASAHMPNIHEYSSGGYGSVDKLNLDMTVLGMLLDTTLRLVTSSFTPRFCSLSEKLSNYKTDELNSKSDVAEFCSMIADTLLGFSDRFCSDYESLPAVKGASILLLHTSECYASIICIYSSKLFQTPPDPDYITSLFLCIETLAKSPHTDLSEDIIIGITRVMTVLAAMESRPKELYIIFQKLFPSMTSLSPRLMLALTSSLPILLKCLPDHLADKIGDGYSELIPNCDTADEWIEFSLELAASIPIITTLLAYPSLTTVKTCTLTSYHSLPLFSSIYTVQILAVDQRSLGYFIQQAEDFLKIVQSFFVSRKLSLPIQAVVITSLFEISFILPTKHPFIPTLLNHILRSSSHALAFLLTKPLQQHLIKVKAYADEFMNRQWSLLDHPSLALLLETSKNIIYDTANSHDKLLPIQFSSDLVFGLNQLGRLHEAIATFRFILQFVFMKDVHDEVCHKVRIMLKGHGDVLVTSMEQKLRDCAFAAVPDFIARQVFKQEQGHEQLADHLNHLTAALDLGNIKNLLEHMLSRLVQLSFMLNLSDDKKLQVFKFIAKHTQRSVSDLLQYNLSNLYSDLIINSQNAEKVNSRIVFLKNNCDDLPGAIKIVENELFSKLALNYSQDAAAVNGGVNLYYSIAYPKPYQGQQAKIEDLINTRFLSMLKCLEDLNNCSSNEQQLVFVKSLNELIPLLDPKCISTAPHKLMASLTTFLQHREVSIVKASFTAWETFTSNLSLSRSDPIWIHIIVTLYNFMCHENVGHLLIPLYTELLFKDECVLCSSSSYVYTASLPADQHFDELRAKLAPFLDKVNEISLTVRLEHAHKGLSHEALSVRKFALEALLPLIESNIFDISQLIMSGPFVDRTISSLIQTLTRSFGLKQDQMNIQLTKCIGALGAVDPSRLSIERRRQESSSILICTNITSNAVCAIQILTELTTYLATNTIHSDDQDFVSLSIQQVLTAYKIPDTKNDIRRVVENNIDKHVWHVIQPYLDSRYILHDNPSVHDEELENLDIRFLSPIYRSEITKTYNHWLSRFCKRLSSFVLHPSAKLLFQACSRLIAQINPNIGFMLLPHMIVHIMLDDLFESNRRNCILEVVFKEFEFVLNIAESELVQPSLKPAETTHLKLIIETILNVFNFLSQLKENQRGKLSRENFKMLDYLSSKVSFLQLVNLSKYCNIFPLALRYLEQHILKENLNLEGNPDIRIKLGDLYRLLEDRESIVGLKEYRPELPSLEESILEQLYEKNISGVLSLYKSGIQRQPDQLAFQIGLIETQLDFGFIYDAKLQLNQFMCEGLEMKEELLPLQLEACWKLSQWEELDKFVRRRGGELLGLDEVLYSNSQTNWRIGLGVLLNCAQRREEIEFFEQLEGMRKQRSSILSTHSFKCVSNDECYQELVRLCMLKELEEGARLLLFSGQESITDSQQELLCRWDRSILCTRNSFKIREPILSLRKAILSMSPLVEKTFSFDLEIAKLSRRCGISQPADTALSKLEHFQQNDPLWLLSNLEKAKYISKFGSGALFKLFSSAAVQHLEKILSIANAVTDVSPEVQDYWDSLIRKVKLLKFRCLLDQTFRDVSSILDNLEQFVNDSPHLDKALFTLAEFQFELATEVYSEYSVTEEPENTLKFTATQQAILNYFKLVRQNTKYMITTMPKAISLWLMTANTLYSIQNCSQIESFFKKLNSSVMDYCYQLQPYHFYCAFSVLLSHLPGTDGNTFYVLAKIIHYVYSHYPTICIWLMISFSNSTNQLCINRIESIFKSDGIENITTEKRHYLLELYERTKKLTKLFFQFPGKDESRVKLSSHYTKLIHWNRELYHFPNSPEFPKIVVPIEHCFQFPINSLNSSIDNLPTISHFTDYCFCFLTLRVPKKIRVQASNGNIYEHIYKQEDDIRKDQRSMEIFMHMNLLMKKDPRCNEGLTFIRTYAVVILSEQCGLIEFVQNRAEMKKLIIELYKHADQPVLKEDIDTRCRIDYKNLDNLSASNTKLLEMCTPPVFHKWFYNTFPIATDWYLARQEYTRSIAVMSMAGYIMGLGDRHLENMLISTQTGNVMHVDFGYLFREAESLPIPESVPYRLTQNILDGMGVLQHEGCFRRTCENVLRCFRNGYQTLFPILQNMNFSVNDVRVVGPNVPQSSRNNLQATIIAKREKKIKGVHLRLKGYCEDERSILSVESQVEFTIQKATDLYSLMRMFGLWMPFI